MLRWQKSWVGYHIIIRLIGWLWFIVHSNYVNNKTKILVYFFHIWWLWWRDWPFSPLFLFLSFPSFPVYFCQIIWKKWMQGLYLAWYCNEMAFGIISSSGTFFEFWHDPFYQSLNWMLSKELTVKILWVLVVIQNFLLR